MIQLLSSMHRLIPRLLVLPLVMAGLITPSKSLADQKGEWVTAPDLKPGYILVGIDAYKLKHHQIKIKKRRRSRIKVEWIITTFDPKSRDVLYVYQPVRLNVMKMHNLGALVNTMS